MRYVDRFPDPHSRRFDKAEWRDEHGTANVIIHCQSSGIAFPKHWGPLSLKTTLSGHEYYVTRHSTHRVSPERLLILNEDTTYASYIRDGETVESFTINFSADFIRTALRDSMSDSMQKLDDPFSGEAPSVQFPEYTLPYHHHIRTRLNRIRRCLTMPADLNGRVDEELSFLYEAMRTLSASENKKTRGLPFQKASTREEMYRRLQHVRDYMDACYAEPINLHDLSRVACLSVHHLIRLFKSHFLCTPHQYLIRCRLLEAKRLTETTSLRIEDITRRVGFEDRSSFSRLFRQHFGKNPSDRTQ